MNEQLRSRIIQTGNRMMEMGLTIGTGGNVSCRTEEGGGMLITPSGIPYAALTPEQIVELDLVTLSTTSKLRPSVESMLHRQIYLARPDVKAVVHVHSPMAIALGVARMPLPVITDICAFSFGGPVEVADYAMSGSDELAANVVRTLGKRNAAIMSNHGSVCVADTPEKALERCELLEKMCSCYIHASQVGRPTSLTDGQMEDLIRSLGKTYGQNK
jgi:L-fuculose-phosphate aldolase